MSSHTCPERNRLELLQAEYRKSWHSFTVAVEALQSTLIDTEAPSEASAKARAGVEIAVREYRAARNALAECLLESGSAGNDGAMSEAAENGLVSAPSKAASEDGFTPTRILANSRAA